MITRDELLLSDEEYDAMQKEGSGPSDDYLMQAQLNKALRVLAAEYRAKTIDDKSRNYREGYEDAFTDLATDLESLIEG